MRRERCHTWASRFVLAQPYTKTPFGIDREEREERRDGIPALLYAINDQYTRPSWHPRPSLEYLLIGESGSHYHWCAYLMALLWASAMSRT